MQGNDICKLIIDVFKCFGMICYPLMDHHYKLEISSILAWPGFTKEVCTNHGLNLGLHLWSAICKLIEKECKLLTC